MEKTRIGISGAAGRMGKRLVALGSQDSQLRIAAAVEDARHPQLGMDAGLAAGVGPLGITIAAQFDADLDAVIDFSVPEAAAAVTLACVARGIPLVMATTGLSAEQQARIREAAATIPVVWAPSMSLAVNLTMKLAALAGKTLSSCGADADVEIIERHHRFKEDAPSGTALHFGKLIAREMGQVKETHGRAGRPGIRPRDEIGYHAVRVGDNPGEHTIVFGMLGETLELTVRASNRDCYAVGALKAAQFVARQPAGLYTMFDVLGLAE